MSKCKRQTNWTKLLRCQRGNFSPFMFGILIGLSVFSAVASKRAAMELKKVERERVENERKTVEDLRLALESAIMTETSATYSTDLDLTRAKPYSSLTSGKTRGGANIQFNVKDSDTVLGLQNKRALITATDDSLLQNEIAAVGTASAQATYASSKSQPVELVDTAAIRQKQVDLSRQNAETEAAQIYLYYATNLQFPTSVQYDTINERTRMKDYWGADFTYSRQTSQTATLEFTTPWGYTYTMNLSLD